MWEIFTRNSHADYAVKGMRKGFVRVPLNSSQGSEDAEFSRTEMRSFLRAQYLD